MRLKKRSRIQIAITVMILSNCILYYLYLNDLSSLKLLSIRDLNPYGGWSVLKSLFTDVSYRYRGITKAMALTLSIAVTAALFGRIFCGYICPIGALQDFSRFIGDKLGVKEKKLPQHKSFQPEKIKYFLLILLLVLSTIGLGHYLSDLSVWLAYVNLFTGIDIGTGFILLVIITCLSMIYRRVFCRCFCPLGAFQGLFYAIGPLKVNRNESCNGCSTCLDHCPVGIRYSEATEISPECINCLQCIESTCVKNTAGYSIQFAGRRLKNSVYITISLGLLFLIYALLPLSQSYGGSPGRNGMGNIAEGIYQGTGVGFGGNIQVQVTVKENKIEKIDLIDHRETSGYYEEVYRSISRAIIETQSLNVDVISGATATSRGFLNGVKSGVSQAMSKD
ncbi:4Fe-4S binding protein [Geosporobacter ferrireducens]|uniref:Polyferredoxin n=1 Tax=Geosporobacter ferrireducens TaxID=1424294 RepID=A0A1D8GF78_9FIRM|nr:4Fe-4S binding protein [Geosporobacter ferrireducens]AOT69560.1 polyferredoxin [Geosporobacter ferrireducens]